MFQNFNLNKKQNKYFQNLHNYNVETKLNQHKHWFITVWKHAQEFFLSFFSI